MAQLTGSDLKAIRAKFMSDVSSREEALGVMTKIELRTAVDAIDTWVDGNVVSFNSALPLPARTELTAKQKLELFVAVAKRRWEVS